MPSDNELPLIPSDGYIRISSAGGAIVIEDFYEDGTFKASGLVEGQKTRQKFKSRGGGYALRKVEDQDVPYSFEIHLCGFSGGTNGSVVDAYLKQGLWEDAVSTSAAYGDAHTVKVQFFARTQALGADTDAVLTLNYADGELEPSEGVPGKIGISGTAYVFKNDPDSIQIA